MNAAKKLVAIAILTVLIGGLMPFAAHAAKAKNHKVTGSVTAVDMTAKTITILDKKTSASSTISVVDGTKFFQSKPIDESSLAAGDVIRAESKTDITPGSTTVEASHITVLSPLAISSEKTKKKVSEKSIEGTVVSATPTLSITTDDGSNVTITLAAKAKVVESVPATFDDVTVGKHVQASGPMVGTSIAADEVTITTGKGGKRKNQ